MEYDNDNMVVCMDCGDDGEGVHSMFLTLLPANRLEVRCPECGEAWIYHLYEGENRKVLIEKQDEQFKPQKDR